MNRLFLLVLVFLSGCSIMPRQEIPVIIGLSYEIGKFPTKGFADEIAETLPSSVSLTLTNTQTNVAYNVITGIETTLPIGTYTVTGGYEPSPVQKLYGSVKYTCHQPSIVVSDEITIEVGTLQYSVDASYSAFAVGVIPSEVSAWQIRVKDQSMQAVDYISGTGLYWIFVTGSYPVSNPVVMTIAPIVGSSEGFNFVTDAPSDNQIQVEYGKWYILHPASASTQSGTFALGLPEWTEGG